MPGDLTVTAAGGGELAAVLPAGVLRGPRTVVFGVGQRRVVPELVRASGGEALVITDPRLADSPHLGELVDGLRAAGVATRVFDEAAPELPLEQVPQAVDVARRGGTEVVVGFGGGSCIDLAKVVALVLAHGGSAPDYYGENVVPGAIIPVIAIPTTAGTGSEVTPVAVITDPDRSSKVGISSPHLIPAAAVCDPELTVSCPPLGVGRRRRRRAEPRSRGLHRDPTPGHCDAGHRTGVRR